LLQPARLTKKIAAAKMVATFLRALAPSQGVVVNNHFKMLYRNDLSAKTSNARGEMCQRNRTISTLSLGDNTYPLSLAK
jgi:hypothetical protein